MIPVVVSPDSVPVDQQTKLTGVSICCGVSHLQWLFGNQTKMSSAADELLCRLGKSALHFEKYPGNFRVSELEE